MSALTRKDLILQISNETGLRQQDVKAVITRTLEIIAETLSEGRHVELRNFGVFDLGLTPRRLGRNPRHPEVHIEAPARPTVKFRPGKELVQRVEKLGPLLKKRAGR